VGSKLLGRLTLEEDEEEALIRPARGDGLLYGSREVVLPVVSGRVALLFQRLISFPTSWNIKDIRYGTLFVWCTLRLNS